jgi:hypothetical protein
MRTFGILRTAGRDRLGETNSDPLFPTTPKPLLWSVDRVDSRNEHFTPPLDIPTLFYPTGPMAPQGLSESKS